MTEQNTLEALRDRPMTNDRDLARFVTALLERALVERAWLLLVDDSGRMTDVLMPIDDLPSDPRATVAMPSTGAVTAAEMLGERVAGIVAETPAAAVVVVWERPGRPNSPEALRAWVEGMRGGFSRNPRGLRAQLVLTPDGAHPIGEPMARAA